MSKYPFPMSRNTEKAEKLALVAHASQAYGDQPYEVHLRHVQKILAEEGFAQEEILLVSGWLHDVVEDTEVSPEDINREFGPEVADIVCRVTDEPGENRKQRKQETYPKIRGHRAATIIKLCDRIANIEASREVPDKLAMYDAEYPDFRRQVFVPGLCDPLWDRLERLLID